MSRPICIDCHCEMSFREAHEKTNELEYFCHQCETVVFIHRTELIQTYSSDQDSVAMMILRAHGVRPVNLTLRDIKAIAKNKIGVLNFQIAHAKQGLRFNEKSENYERCAEIYDILIGLQIQLLINESLLK